MTETTDPSTAMVSFQQALRAGQVEVTRCVLDRDLYTFADEIRGRRRFSFVRLKMRRTVTAFVNAVSVDPVEGHPCYQLGCAVPEKLQGKGVATKAVRSAIAELGRTLAAKGIRTFYVEAVVHHGNLASRRVAERAFTPDPHEVIDGFTGQPSFQFLLKVENQHAA